MGPWNLKKQREIMLKYQVLDIENSIIILFYKVIVILNCIHVYGY